MAFCSQCGTESLGGAFCTECGSALDSTTKKTEKKSFDNNTPLSKRCLILSELWMQYKNEEGEFADFISHCDLAMPVAYLVSMDIIELNATLTMFVNEAWDLLLEGLAMPADTGFESLEDLFASQN